MILKGTLTVLPPNVIITRSEVDKTTVALIVDLRTPLGKAEVITETGAKSILEHGLPRRMIPWSTSSVSQNKIPVNKPGQMEIPYPAINGLWAKLQKQRTHGTWAGYMEDATPPSTEAGIATYLSPFFEDLARALTKILGDQFHINFQPEKVATDIKADMWVLVRNARPVGAVEVKKWGPEAMRDPKILGEVYDQLMKLRSFEGIDQAYGILTCWNEWRFCCLEDTIEDAKKTEMPEIPTANTVPPALIRLMPQELRPWPNGKMNGTSYVTPPTPPTSATLPTEGQSSTSSVSQPSSKPSGSKGKKTNKSEDVPSSADIPRKLGVSPVITLNGISGEENQRIEGNSGENDQALLNAVASVLVKMAFSTESKLQSLLDPNRPVRHLLPKESESKWTKLGNRALDFSELPEDTAGNFLLLLDLGAGTFGHCYLAVPHGGTRACVLKLYVGIPGNDFLPETEAQRWREIWDLDRVRSFRLNTQDALQMPYLKMCTGNYNAQNPDTRDATRQAVEVMAKKGYRHNEALWRHVGLCRYRASKRGQESLKAVLIDLGNVTAIDETDEAEVAEAIQEMLNSLGFPAN